MTALRAGAERTTRVVCRAWFACCKGRFGEFVSRTAALAKPMPQIIVAIRNKVLFIPFGSFYFIKLFIKRQEKE